MSQTTINTLFVLVFGIANVLVPAQEEPQVYYYLTGLDGGVLTAYPGPEGDGHLYPAPGQVFNEALVEGNKGQEWAIFDQFDEEKSLISQENSYNEINVLLQCDICFPVTNNYLIEETSTPGVVYLSTTLLGDDKKSCVQNNGLNERITFGECDRTEGSSSQWRIVPIIPVSVKQ